MTALDISTNPAPSSADPKPLGAPRSQTSFDRSAQIWPCSSRAWEENTFSPIPEASQDDVFPPSPSIHRDTSTTPWPPRPRPTPPPLSLTKWIPTDRSQHLRRIRPTLEHSEPPPRVHPTTRNSLLDPGFIPVRTKMMPLLHSRGDEGPPALNYSCEHRADAADRHRYPKRQLQNCLLAIMGRGSILSVLTLLTFISLMSTCPSATADRFALRNSYGTVENCYHLTAYDCSDPTQVQAYSSIPARPCSVRTTPVQRERPTRLQLLQKEQKRYITAYSCFLCRTDIRYNCGMYGHPELDPIYWSFSVPQRVPYEQCLDWIRTRDYRPSVYSTMMHGRNLHYPISLNEPT